MTFLLAIALIAAQAYTTADPVDPARMGLATPDGRYSLELGEGCEAIGSGVNVWLDDVDGVVTLDGTCYVVSMGLMSETPCFTLEDVCDVAAEQAE